MLVRATGEQRIGRTVRTTTAELEFPQFTRWTPSPRRKRILRCSGLPGSAAGVGEASRDATILGVGGMDAVGAARVLARRPVSVRRLRGVILGEGV